MSAGKSPALPIVSCPAKPTAIAVVVARLVAAKLAAPVERTRLSTLTWLQLEFPIEEADRPIVCSERDDMSAHKSLRP